MAGQKTRIHLQECIIAKIPVEEINYILIVILFDGEDVSHQIWTCTFYSHVISKVTYFHGWINGVPIKDVDKILLCNTRY